MTHRPSMSTDGRGEKLDLDDASSALSRDWSEWKFLREVLEDYEVLLLVKNLEKHLRSLGGR